MKKILVTISLVLLLFACTKNTYNTELLPTPTATISGKVLLYDSTGNALTNLKGAAVSLDSTNYSATTDSTGMYVIKNIPAGLYTFTFSKVGYYTHKVFNVNVLGAKTTEPEPTQSLFMPSNVVANVSQITLFYANDVPMFNVGVSIVTQSATYINDNVVVFVSASSSVSSSNYTTSFVISNVQGQGNLVGSLFNPSLYFSIGSTLYFTAYATSAKTFYTDPTTGKTVYEGLGPASGIFTTTAP